MLQRLSRLRGLLSGAPSRSWNCSSEAPFTYLGFSDSASICSLLTWRTVSRSFATGAFQPTASAVQATRNSRLQELLAIYKQLSKFRLSFLVMTTATAGFIAGEVFKTRDQEPQPPLSCAAKIIFYKTQSIEMYVVKVRPP